MDETEVPDRIAELESMVVWAVRHGAAFYSYDQRVYWVERARQFAVSNHAQTDGTDAGILAALRRAMEGEK